MSTPTITESEIIPGVLTVDLRPFIDERGRFTEIFRKAWFPQRSWDVIQTNHSFSRGGVLRGLHYHFKQVDYWYLANGRIRVGMVDLRKNSPAYKQTLAFDLDAANGQGLFIPVGIAHGFVALSDAMLIYVVDNYYNGGDELGLTWNDPVIKVDWRLNHKPVLSDRDAANPRFEEIPPELLPR